MRFPPLLDVSARIGSHALAACLATSLLLPVQPPALAAAPPSAEAQATLRKGMEAAAAGLLPSADLKLSSSIDEWKRSAQPPDEVSALLKTRAGVRRQQARLTEALADLDEAVPLLVSPEARPDPAEVQRTYALRARVNAELGRWKPAEADLSAAIERLETLDAIEATNPFLFAERSAARARLGQYEGAADDALRAAVDFQSIGDRVRRLGALADASLALYGAGDVSEATAKMKLVFSTIKGAASNNPDDIGLLQELSQKEAELHLAYAGHLLAADGKRAEAEAQWQTGCVRLEGFVQDAQERSRAEAELRAAEAAQAEALGKEAPPLKAASVKNAQFNNDFGLAARISGLDPDSPYLSQRPQRSWAYFQVGEGPRVRDTGVALAEVDPGLSCARFRSAAWLADNRPAWPPALRDAAEQYAAAVPQGPIVMPGKPTPPKDCVVFLRQQGIGDAVPCFPSER